MDKHEQVQNNNNTSFITLEQALNIHLHEVASVIHNLKSITNSHLFDAKYIKALSDEKLELIKNDMIGSIDILRSLCNNLKVVISDPNSKMDTYYENVYIFKDIVFKLKNTYKLDMQSKLLEIVTPQVTLTDELRSVYKTSKIYVEQILGNLITNAIKYSFWGTNVFIDCISSSDGKRRNITVTDYGSSMYESNEPYKLFFRGNDIDHVSGTGIGLYVANTLAKRLGGSMHHKCTLVSNYYVPLIDAYLYCDFEKMKDDKLKEQLLLEKRRLKDNNIFERVVSQGLSYHTHKEIYDLLPEQMIIQKICDKTYEATFEVEI